MSLAIYLSQIQQPSWWNSVPAAKACNNNVKRQVSSDYQRAEIVRLLSHSKGPVMFADLVEDMEVTAASLRGLLKPMVDGGMVKRSVVNNLVYLELIQASEGETA